MFSIFVLIDSHLLKYVILFKLKKLKPVRFIIFGKNKVSYNCSTPLKYLRIFPQFKNLTRTWALDLRKTKRPKKRTRWKNQTSRTKKCYNLCQWLIFVYRYARPRFCVSKVWKMYHKFLFWKQRNWYQSNNVLFVVLTSLEPFHMFTQFYVVSFSIKRCFYETSNVSCLEY